MQTQSKSNSNSNSNSRFSLCIPRLTNDVGYKEIYDAFIKLNIGNLCHIDIIEKKNVKGIPTKRALIYFKYWFNNENATFIKERLYSDKDIKIVYQFPWYWKVALNKSKKVAL